MPDGASRPAGRPPGRRGWWWWWLVAALVVNWVVASVVMAPPARTNVSYTFFSQQLAAGNVQTVTTTADTIQGAFTRPVAYPPGAPDAAQAGPFVTQRPSFATDDLYGTLAAKGVTVNADPPDAPAPLWQQLLVGLLVWFARRSAAGSGALGGFGRSHATRYEPAGGPRTTFADVAGIDEDIRVGDTDLGHRGEEPAGVGQQQARRRGRACATTLRPSRTAWLVETTTSNARSVPPTRARATGPPRSRGSL